MAAERPASWSRAQRLLHWAIAALVLLAAPMGVYMVALPFQQLLLKFLLYQLHKTIGITAFILALSQLALHWRRGRPAWDSGLPGWQRRAASAVHATLFGLLLVTPFLGYLTAATAPARIPTLFLGIIPVPHIVGTDPAWYAVLRQVHLGLALLLVVLAFGHALMALHHHRAGNDTLVRIWRGRPRTA
ncbi:MAG TPA: cytochrome b/b6 domain-containing protein, partial [Crenalkalicoccus sp.]|nr:cytochrome b/b6 domain-containing protein [Crenalkalicoccus sp.]